MNVLEHSSGIKIIELFNADLMKPDETKVAIEKVVMEGVDNKFVVLLKGVNNICSMGVSVLVSIHILGTIDDNRICFAEPDDSLSHFFTQTQMDQVITIFENLEDAIEHLQSS